MKALYVKSGSVFAILSLLIAFGSSLPHAAQAGDDPQICGPRDIIIQRLAARFEERQSAVGMTNGGSLVELFVSPNGTWTFVHTNGNGITCLLAAGEDWEPTILETTSVAPTAS